MRAKVDPLLVHLLGDPADDVPVMDDSQLPDPIADAIFRQQFGIEPDSARTRPLRVEEVAKALENLRLSLRDSPSEEKQALLAKLSEASELFCAEESFVYKFLHAAAARNDHGMRESVRELISASKDEIIEIAKRLADPSTQRGEAGTTKKLNGWSYVYDATGELESAYEGDTPPFFN
jgi:hypothetical protein